MLIILVSSNSYLIGASYGYFNDFHISTYGEAILLAIQSECKSCIKGSGYEARFVSSSTCVYHSKTECFLISPALQAVLLSFLHYTMENSGILKMQLLLCCK